MTPKKAQKKSKDHPRKGETTGSCFGNYDPSQDVDPMEQDEDLSLPVAAMEYVWLFDHRRGISLRKIAERDGVSIERVKYGLDRAMALEVRCSGEEGPGNPGRRDEPEFELIPLFPIGAFTPQSTCSHRNPIEKGSRFCCMVCHASGMDDHPGLQRDLEAKPAARPTSAPMKGVVEPAVPSDGGLVETRKQRRRRRFSAVAVA